MMASGMVEKGASILAIILATFILNLRHVIMSTCVFERMHCSKTWMKLLAAFVGVFFVDIKEDDNGQQ